MKQTLSALTVVLVALTVLAVEPPAPHAQGSTHINSGGTLPTHCTPGDLWHKTGASAGLYDCSATDTWTGPLVASAGGAGTVTNTGTLTANLPVFGNGSADVTIGSRTGNTTKVATSTGSLTSGNCAKWDASGNVVDAGAACGGGASGSLILLEQHTASSSASLDFTSAISSTYDQYVIELIGIVPATNAALPYLRFSTDGGSTYDATSGHYGWSQINSAFGGASGVNTKTSDTGVVIFGDAAGAGLLNTATPALAASVTLFDPGSTANEKIVTMQGIGVYSGTSTMYQFTASGVYTQTSAVNALRFIMSSGNITSGTIRVYGIAK